jgi:flavin-dependent dehydrogenase
MQKYDVLVVGAGPAGSAAAKKCVDRGLKTLLIDKQKLPRRKACSGIIDNLSQNYVLENFGPIPQEAFSRPNISRGMAFYFPSVGTVLQDVDSYMPYVWRDRFDHFLAITSGAELRDGTRFHKMETKGDAVEAVLKEGKKEYKVRASYLIAGDGARSRVILNHAPEVYKGLPFAFACQKYYEGTINASDRHLYWFMARDMGPFPWLNIKDDQIIIGLGMMHGQKFKPKFDRLMALLKDKFDLKIKRELATESCLVSTAAGLNRFYPGRGRVMMVGDAMGLMHQGHCSISCALASGGYAGEAAAEGVEHGVDALARYKQLVRPEMELCLDQFNPLRMMSSSASSASNQPSFFHGLSRMEKAMAIRDGLSFVRNEFGQVDGLVPAMFKNMLQRLLLRRYVIPAAD